MKIEYVTSSLGIGTELHISAAEYKRVNSEAGFNDHANMLFAVKAYAVTEGDIIPVITSNDGSEFTIDFSNKTIREKNRIRKEE